MTDLELLAKKLARIETLLRELRELVDPAEIGRDLRAERFAEHTLQIAIQAALDAASHIVSDRRLGEPKTNRELFELLARDGWIPAPLAVELALMAGFRNVLVHGYDDVDLEILRDVMANRVGDLQRYVAALRRKLGLEPA